SNIERVRGRKRLRMGLDPAPDLVVEVVVSHPVADALKVHASLGVGEVWVCRENRLEILALRAGRYEVFPTSGLLPFLAPDELAPLVFRQDLPSESEVRYQFRAWVAATLAPRYRPDADA